MTSSRRIHEDLSENYLAINRPIFEEQVTANPASRSRSIHAGASIWITFRGRCASCRDHRPSPIPKPADLPQPVKLRRHQAQGKSSFVESRWRRMTSVQDGPQTAKALIDCARLAAVLLP